MKKAIIGLTLIVTLGLFVFIGVSILPFYYYHKSVNRNYTSEWFRLDRYDSKYLSPNKEKIFQNIPVDNPSLWKMFHFSNVRIPMPVKNPYYFVVPKLQYDQSNFTTKFGFSILDAEDVKIFEIYLLPTQEFPNYLAEQKIFQLPLVKKLVESYTDDQIWDDVFTEHIGEWDIGIKKMMYNLYLLQFRSKFLPANYKSYSKLKGTGLNVVELNYPDMDYKAELVLNKRGDKIFSYIMISKLSSTNAIKIKAKYMNEVEYLPSTPTLTDIIIREFKSLNYNDQIDHEGMLYLTSAWSHQQNNYKILEKIIFFLERGIKNEKQLEPFYRYLYHRYKKVFSRRQIKNLKLDPKIILQRNIELEEQEKIRREFIEKDYQILTPLKKKTIDEQYEDLIEETSGSEKMKKEIRLE